MGDMCNPCNPCRPKCCPTDCCDNGIFGGASSENMPSTKISRDDLGKSILDIMLLAKLIPSKGEGRRLVQQGGVSIDGNKVTDFNLAVTEDMFNSNELIIKKGKKVFHKIIL